MDRHIPGLMDCATSSLSGIKYLTRFKFEVYFGVCTTYAMPQRFYLSAKKIMNIVIFISFNLSRLTQNVYILKVYSETLLYLRANPAKSIFIYYIYFVGLIV